MSRPSRSSSQSSTPIRCRRTPSRGLTALVVLGTAMLGLVLGATQPHDAHAADPPETWVEDCTEWHDSRFEGTCPGERNPQREDPWAPTVTIGMPPEGPDCEQVKIILDELFLAECPEISPPTVDPMPMLVIGLGEGSGGANTTFSLTPDFGDDAIGDIIPFSMCMPRADFQGTVSYLIDHDEHGTVLLDRGRIRAYCCSDC